MRACSYIQANRLTFGETPLFVTDHEGQSTDNLEVSSVAMFKMYLILARQFLADIKSPKERVSNVSMSAVRVYSLTVHKTLFNLLQILGEISYT